MGKVSENSRPVKSSLVLPGQLPLSCYFFSPLVCAHCRKSVSRLYSKGMCAYCVNTVSSKELRNGSPVEEWPF